MRGRNRWAFLGALAVFGANYVLADPEIYGSRTATLWFRIPQAVLCVGGWAWLRHPQPRRRLESVGFVLLMTIILTNGAAMLVAPREAVGNFAFSILVGCLLIALAANYSWKSTLALPGSAWLTGLVAQLLRLSPSEIDFVGQAIMLIPVALVVTAARANNRLRRAEFEARTALQAATHRLRSVEDARTRLFVNLSHDFKTPLAVIHGEAELLESSASCPGDGRSVRRIRNNALALADLTEQLLEIARLDEGRTPCHPSTCEMAALARERIALHQPSDSAPIELELLSDQAFADVDPDHARRILSNLLSNAVRQTRPGRRSMGVRIEQRPGRSEVTIEVWDDGTGVPPHRRETIFDRFVSFDAAGSVASGIGLPLARELAELNGGSLELVEGAPRTTFRLLLRAAAPLAPGAALPRAAGAPEQQLAAVSERADLPSRARLPDGASRIVVVEDSEEMAGLLARILGQRFGVQCCSCVADARAVIMRAPPDAIVCDVMLPDGDGYEIVDFVRRDRKLEAVPFVFVSALGELDQRIRGIRGGADDYLPKPFAADELLARVSSAISRSQARRRALLLQREQFLAELHDGVTACLTRALVLVPGNTDDPDRAATDQDRDVDRTRWRRVREALREGLAEAREMLALLEEASEPWEAVIGDIRHALATACEPAAVMLEFETSSDGSCPHLSPSEVHTLRRVAREAAHNALQHARARRVHCALRAEQGSCHFRFLDDGQGGGPPTPTGGRGLGIIRRRVSRLRGKADIGAGPDGGFIIAVTFPVGAAWVGWSPAEPDAAATAGRPFGRGAL